MKQFFSTALGAFVGAFFAMFICGILSFIISIVCLVGFAGIFSAEETPQISDNSILKIELSGFITEREVVAPEIESLIKQEKQNANLKDILKSIEIASTDSKIKGIYLDCKDVSCGLASSYEIREALKKFKNSGKWIYSYADFYTQSAYYIASASDSIFINPEGIVEFSGLGVTIPYFKTLLDKLGIEIQVFKVGTFKSAVEPYILTEMSDANRLQTKHFLGNMWKEITQDISKSRNIKEDKINSIADSIVLSKPVSYLLSNHLVDAQHYSFNFEKKLKAKVGIDKSDDLNFVSPKDLIASSSKKEKDDKIAILYAVGEINSESTDGIVATKMIENILDAADDDDIKGLVMRVNSPGGSAFDSEQIWAALEEFKKTGKPFAVSMGDYAASGGYYISCGADKIFAEPLTLTGSIGIFGIVPNLKKLSTDIGINFNEVATNENGNFPSLMKPMTPIQAQSFQSMVNRGYELFTSRCATGRHMPIDSLKAIAEGRVWDGKSAVKLKLVDELGSMEDAVKWVAEKAKVKDYSLQEMPKQKELWEEIIDKYFNQSINIFLSSEYDAVLSHKDLVKKLLKLSPIQARSEVEIKF